MRIHCTWLVNRFHKSVHATDGLVVKWDTTTRSGTTKVRWRSFNVLNLRMVVCCISTCTHMAPREKEKINLERMLQGLGRLRVSVLFTQPLLTTHSPSSTNSLSWQSCLWSIGAFEALLPFDSTWPRQWRVQIRVCVKFKGYCYLFLSVFLQLQANMKFVCTGKSPPTGFPPSHFLGSSTFL